MEATGRPQDKRWETNSTLQRRSKSLARSVVPIQYTASAGVDYDGDDDDRVNE